MREQVFRPSRPFIVNLAFGIAGAMGLSTTHPVFALPSYTITDLGTLGGNSSSAADINNSGQVVGSSVTSQGKTHAFRYADNVGMKDLGVAPTREIIKHDTSAASGINDKGQVVGGSRPGQYGSNVNHCFRYTDGVGMVNLTEAHNPSFAAAYGSGIEINNFARLWAGKPPPRPSTTLACFLPTGKTKA